MRKTMLTMALLLAGSVTGVSAQGDPQQRIAEALERARARGLPVALLESKVAEGRAKNVPMDRIAFAVEQRAVAMSRAADVLGRALDGQIPAPEDIAMGADALQAGVQEAVLARIATTAGSERRTVAIAALTQLVANGTLPEEALRRVEAAMQRGNEALMNLPGMAGSRAGQGPPEGIPPAGRPGGNGRPPGTPPTGGPPGGGGPPSGGGI